MSFRHIDCVANYDESRVEFYLGMASKEQNKALFDFLFARKDSIEAVMGMQLIWNRMDDHHLDRPIPVKCLKKTNELVVG